MGPCEMYFEPSDQETTLFMSVQVPGGSGAQHPARNGTMQLVSTGLVGSEQASPPSVALPPVPLDDEELPPVPVVVLVVVVVVPAPPEPVGLPLGDEDEQPVHAT